KRDHLVLARTLFIGTGAPGRVGIEGRALMAGAAAKHIAQLVEDHDRRDQEENRTEVEEAHVFRQLPSGAAHLPAGSFQLVGKGSYAFISYRTGVAIIQIKRFGTYVRENAAPPVRPATAIRRLDRLATSNCVLPSGAADPGDCHVRGHRQ